MIKRSIIFFLFLYSASGFAQDLYSPSAVLAEQNRKTVMQKLYLHTDKSFYVAGDIIWFKVYNVEGRNNKPMVQDRVVYAELVDGQNKPVAQAKISMTGKSGSGSFQLPLNLNTGNYILRSYTSGMKNQPAEFFFHKSISVVNPLRSPEPDTARSSDGFYNDYYPEGGNLVEGISSRIAFHVKDFRGKGADAYGFLLDENNDTLQKINTSVFGMGSFELAPVKGKQYKLSLHFANGYYFHSALPKPEEKGYVMKVEEQPGNSLKIIVKSNVAADGTEMVLLGHTRQVEKTVQKTNMAGGQSVFIVNRNVFGKGVSVLTVFAGGVPVCERLIFEKPSVADLKAGTDQEEYFTRKKVNVNIENNSADPSLLSLAVYKIDTLQHRDEMDILNYLWLTSDIRGDVEHPAYYFSEGAEQAADLLMLTKGWRRFSFKHIQKEQQSSGIYPVESGGHIVMARAFDPSTQKPAKEISLFLSVPSTKHKLYAAVTDENGIARFQVKDFFGTGEMILQASPADSMYRLEFAGSFSDKPLATQIRPYEVSSADITTLEQYSIAMQASNIYHGEKLSRFYEPDIRDSFAFYGLPTASYDLDDYKRFTTMEEVLREYVREINVGVRGSGLSLKIFNQNTREMKEGNNLVTIDGVPLFKTHKIFDYDPLKFKKIEVIPLDYVLGKERFNAIAAFYTYERNFEGMEASPGALVVNYEGLQNQREFFAPEYQSEQQILSRVPDFRTTLHWQASVVKDKIEFFTSDTKGRYLVSLQGFDANGNPVSWSKFIDVK